MEESTGKSMSFQVRLVTKQESYSIPDYPYSLQANVGPEELNKLINQMLLDDQIIKKSKEFDFLVGGEFLRGTLEEIVLRHEAAKEKIDDDGVTADETSKIGTEEVFEVEYIEKHPAPEPQDCFVHDDWVSAVDANEDWIITGSYDAAVHFWDLKGKHLDKFIAHEAAIKSIAIISKDSKTAVFATGSHDQTMIIWEWNLENNKVTSKFICKGHEKGIESIKQDPTPDPQMIASGSWDGYLKIWSTSINDEKNDLKGAKIEDVHDNSKGKTRTPLMTLAGHKECVSSLSWTESHEVISSSWDHTIKLWDIEMGGIKSELAGNKAFFDLSWSNLNHTAITSSADRHIRLYDPRSKEGSIVKSTFTSHTGWVSSVNWSTVNENLFISGSYDKLMNLWDRRSPRAPLYTMTGHTDKILCTSWSNPKLMLSGSSDNTLRLFKA